MFATVKELGSKYTPRRSLRLARREPGNPSSCCSKSLISIAPARLCPPPHAGRGELEFQPPRGAKYPCANQSVSYLRARLESRNRRLISNKQYGGRSNRQFA